MIDEGYVKYQCHWIETKPLPYKKIAEINQWRDKLYQLNLLEKRCKLSVISRTLSVKPTPTPLIPLTVLERVY